MNSLPIDESEKACYFVSTRGIAKTCDQCPVWNLNGTVSYPLVFNNATGSTIYMMFDWVESFINGVVPQLERSFILVSGNSDHTTPTDFPSAARLLEDPKCLAWFSQNCISQDGSPVYHPKLHQMPIGIDYHTLTFPRGEHEWGKSGVPPLQQEEELRAVLSTMKPLEETSYKAITNFHLAMDSPPRRAMFRKPIYHILKQNSNIIWLPQQPRLQFWKECNEYAFVISPFGNGLDTHRTWEVLALGRVPIVCKSPLNQVFEGLPFIEVEDWNIITEEWLKEQHSMIVQKMKNNEYKLERLTLAYWVSRIKKEASNDNEE
jgi:hypothetical protein